MRDIEAGFDSFLLHPGDLGYAEGSTVVWDTWAQLIEPISKAVPYMVTVGNHEYNHVGLGGTPVVAAFATLFCTIAW